MSTAVGIMTVIWICDRMEWIFMADFRYGPVK